MKCKYCGVEVPKESQFCPNCGKDLSKLKKCVKCGEIIDDDATFCPHCGAEQPVYLDANPHKKWIWIVAAILVLVLVSGGGYYFMSNNNKRATTAENPTVADTTTNKADSVSAKSMDAATMKIPSFSQLINFYKKGIYDPGISNAESILSQLKEMNIEQIYYKRKIVKSDMEDQPDHDALDIVYGRNVKFEVLSYDNDNNIASSQLTPTKKDFFAIQLLDVDQYDNYTFNDMLVYVSNQDTWNQLRSECVKYGAESEGGENSFTYTYDNIYTVFIYFETDEGKYVVRFDREH